ncbi:ABC transporter permease [uncultured Methanospirillum sp.]|uniref:ABC transporter permease n=1 Tax=uncultured Methanospirillum sp. TaxID=262503 RepID=UPI0029C76939|nr:ABC transporter permease [uncultured Methanospirillum sp.]
MRTLLTIIGVAIAIAVLYSLLSFNAGYERQLSGEMNSLGVSLLAVPKGCPYEAASLVMHGGVIPKYLNESNLQTIRSTTGVEIATPMLLQQFTNNGKSHVVYGIESAEMQKIKPWWKVQGRFFTDDEKNVMVIGSALAELDGAKVGDTIPIGQAKEHFSIVGILEQTGGQDDQSHFLPIDEAQRIFKKEGRINTIAVLVKDPKEVASVSDEIEKIPDTQVVTMSQISGTIMNLVGSARTLLFSLIAVAIVISAFGIMNTLLMSVHERSREFGMMKAIGASGTDIGIMIMIETILVTTAGGILGIFGSFVGAGMIEKFVRSNIPYAPAGSLIAIEPVLIGECLLFSVILGLICGLYPAIRSSRLSPMEAIRSEFE